MRSLHRLRSSMIRLPGFASSALFLRLCSSVLACLAWFCSSVSVRPFGLCSSVLLTCAALPARLRLSAFVRPASPVGLSVRFHMPARLYVPRLRAAHALTAVVFSVAEKGDPHREVKTEQDHRHRFPEMGLHPDTRVTGAGKPQIQHGRERRKAEQRPKAQEAQRRYVKRMIEGLSEACHRGFLSSVSDVFIISAGEVIVIIK